MAEGNGRAFAADVMELGDRIAALSPGRAGKLRAYLEQAHGIKPAVALVVEPEPPPLPPPPPTHFDVVLDGVADPARRVLVIKLIREVTGLGVKDARDLVEGAPTAVRQRVPVDEAEAIKKKLEEGSARVSLKPA